MKNITAIIAILLASSLTWVPCLQTGNYFSQPLHPKSYQKNNFISPMQIIEKTPIEYPIPNVQLFEAIERNNESAVNALINRDFDIITPNHNKHTPLMHATIKGHLEIAKLLISAKAPVNSQNNHGATALTYAAINDNKDIAHLLIENNAHLDPMTNKGFTPLTHAVSRDYTKIAIMLLLAGADLDIVNNNGQNVLDQAQPKTKQAILDIQNTIIEHIDKQDWLQDELIQHLVLSGILPVKVLAILVFEYANPLFDKSLHILIKKQILKNIYKHSINSHNFN